MESTSQLNLDEIVSELQVIKCVVVGDTGVGKTRLICARAFGTKYTLQQLVQTHVPTVWAIDQYRKNPQALQRSWCSVDNVHVSLRLWDTFGDHHKDRRFAYGRADVILVCFSVVQPRSLQHVWNHWHPEIQRLCPRVPIILCGCQVDMRHMYRDPSFIEIDKGPFFKEILDDHILLPEAGRTVAQQIGAYYYETSVLEQYGIEFLFTNVVRAALVYKRDCHFWNNFGLLKGINRPLFQPPHLPPKQPRPETAVPEPLVTDNVIEELLRNETFCDVVFLVQKVPIAAHKVCLLASSSVFDSLFLPICHESSLFTHQGDVGNDNDGSPSVWSKGFEFGATNVALSVETLNDAVSTDENNGRRTFGSSSGKMFMLIESTHELKALGLRGFQGMTVVLVNESVSPVAFQSFLEFLYTGKLVGSGESLNEVRHISQSVGLTSVVNCIENIRNNEEYLNREIFTDFQNQANQKLVNTIIPNCLLSDVEFKLDDGQVKAHRVLLSLRCDVMASMFSSNFMEASAKVDFIGSLKLTYDRLVMVMQVYRCQREWYINLRCGLWRVLCYVIVFEGLHSLVLFLWEELKPLQTRFEKHLFVFISYPGVTTETFRVLQTFLYTGHYSDRPDVNRMELIELANRLCLPQFLAFAEHSIVCELTTAEKSDQNITEEVLMYLEPAQLHNAAQLANWCLWYLSTNYLDVYRQCSKHLHGLRPENQIYLTNNRHPPLWYLKEVDIYERCVLDVQREKTVRRHYPHRQSKEADVCGCLCFSGRRN